jgi:hypothetical protein
VAYPAEWNTSLDQWLRRVKLHPAPHSYGKLFGQEWDVEALLQRCRGGRPEGARGLDRDVKLIWDFSRAHALFTNAAADPGQLESGAAFVRRWRAANEDTNAPAWTCAMDVALRAVNWIFADVLYQGRLGQRVGPDWATSLWQHGWMVWQRLEARLISSNHYLADLVGLMVVGSVFPNDPHAKQWQRFARAEFPRALLAQTRGDGGLDEASLRYHAFVTEMALVFRLAQSGPWPDPAEERLRAMCQIVADFRDSTGDLFPLGDDDSGRVLGLDFASTAGRADVLLALSEAVLGLKPAPAAEAIYKNSGWWVRRTAEFAVVAEFGGVGLHGLGAHAHNDDLSFCLEWRGKPVLVDPGTFLYTSDPVSRDRFRSTAYHNTLSVDGQEQRALGPDPFALPGRNVPWPAQRLTDGMAFTRELAGAVQHRREIVGKDDGVVVQDTVSGPGRHRLDWRFHLHPGVLPTVVRQGVLLAIPGAGKLLLSSPAPFTAAKLTPTEYSPGYGRKEPASSWVVGGEFALPYEACFEIRPAE